VVPVILNHHPDLPRRTVTGATGVARPEPVALPSLTARYKLGSDDLAVIVCAAVTVMEEASS
jgi:hypothetical protein